ncbi:hypothetical protein ASG54_24115 [Aureimonas sp. Leaf460]|nr:hypothetical protein ASG54_24115 [Aureimonas sp. Leaf460]KQT68679.1 hypothetical protein ASG62_18875 [Aureimonas sp. Leaf427]
MNDRRGNFALVAAIATLPLILSVGVGIDGARYYKARSHLQQAVDMAALAVAASIEQDTGKLREQAEIFIRDNLDMRTIESVALASFDATSDEVSIRVAGSLPTTFMKLAKFEQMDFETMTVAKRSPERMIEVALVLDNTYSMGVPDPSTGETRIATLRKAGKSLVEALVPVSNEGTVSIALVPYADHVNVGVGNKSASWLALDAAERTETGGGDRVCEPRYKTGKTKKVCKKYSQKTCTTVKDGIPETYSCDDQCLLEVEEDEYDQKCTGTSAWTKTYKFWGCVGTRTSMSLRLSDASPASKYPGYVERSQTCARPIISLTKDRPALLAGVAAMTHETSKDYAAYTHIPSGVVWGLNVLSPLPPFEEAEPYDEENLMPRKVMILMTDGDNTLIHDSRGKHVKFDSKTADAQFKSVNKDTLDICTNAKKNGIEIYSIAFAVTKQEAKDLLKGCASDTAHYYDANDAAKLTAAFSGIARSINQVRLAQ